MDLYKDIRINISKVDMFILISYLLLFILYFFFPNGFKLRAHIHLYPFIDFK